MGASVKIMLSHDYCHFEICKSTDDIVTDNQINIMRKDVQRLADEAVRQYKVMKQSYDEKSNRKYDKEVFLKEVETIRKKNEADRTVREIAMLKQCEDIEWMKRFEYEYNYDDDQL